MKKVVGLISFAVLGLWAGGFVWFAALINSYPPSADVHTEAIVVLTGGRNRIAEAIKLLNADKADKLFISGVSRASSLAAIQRRNQVKIEYPEKVTIGRFATNTIGNAIESRDWVKQNKISSIRLVTSNYHIPRSIIEFKAQNPLLKIIIHPVYSEKVSKKWWKSWHTFSLIFAEYNKFIYVYIRTRLQPKED